MPIGIRRKAKQKVTVRVAAELKEVRHAQMRELAREAMSDPDFIADMRDTMNAFDHARGSTMADA